MKQAVLDIVIVNHRTPDDLAACLASIEQYPVRGEDGYDAPHTVSIVHTVPERLDLEVAERFVRHNQNELRHWTERVWEDNVGYNVACNHAAADGDAEFIAFLNADASTTVDAFSTLCNALRENPTWGIIGPRQVNSANKLVAAGTIGTNEAHELRAWQQDDLGQCSDIRDDAVCVAGSFLMMRRSVFDVLTECPTYQELVDQNGPWGDFSHYFGDQWLGFHARAHGYLCTYFGPVQARHEWHRSSAVGGYGETMWGDDRARFVELCKAHEIGFNP